MEVGDLGSLAYLAVVNPELDVVGDTGGLDV